MAVAVAHLIPADTSTRKPGAQEPAAGSSANPERIELDLVLALIERRALSALELRMLLRLHAGQASIRRLAETLGRDTTEVLLAAERLTDRGFARRLWQGPDRQAVYSIGRPGILTIEPLLTAAGRPPRAAA